MPVDPEVALRVTFDTANWWSEVSVILVVVGVVAEFIALLVWAKEMPRSEKVCMVLATFMVAVGCGGEWLFGGRATSAARQLSDIVENKAAIANADAGKANERAGSLEKEAADTRAEAAHLEAENIKMAAKMAPRTLKELRFTKLFLHSNPLSLVVHIESYALDLESALYAQQIINEMHGTSAVVQDCILTQAPLGGLTYGIWVYGKDGRLVQSLKDDLAAERPGVAPPRSQGGMSLPCGENKEPDVSVFVGVKPLPEP